MSASRADAIELMASFADRTGLTLDTPPKRYLWTDAFALCNWLELYRESRDELYRELATKLIEQVHSVLGRHRPDDARSGWLSGLPDEQGAQHPTAGGLRIGKPLPERRADEPFDQRLEWERDGQYFHYLTKWIDALVRAAVILDQARYHTYAKELATAVLEPFLQMSATGRPAGIAWKMSIDLRRPLIAGMNPHDSLDGYVTYRFVAETDSRANDPQLASEVSVLRQLTTDVQWGTSDPLGIGGLLLDAFRLAILPGRTPSDEELLGNVLVGAEAGLEHFLTGGELRHRPSARLAFRELGLAIGLQTLQEIDAAMRSVALNENLVASLRSLLSFGEIGRFIVDFWSEPRNRSSEMWNDHRDINDVMLCATILGAQVGSAPFSAAD